MGPAKTTTRRTALVAVALALVAFTVVTTSALADTSNGRAGQRVIRLRVVKPIRHGVDSGRRGVSAGDSTLVAARLLNRANGKVAGALFEQCTMIEVNRFQSQQCQATVSLRSAALGTGDITVQGVEPSFPPPHPFGQPFAVTFAVTGGTGDFDGASGSLVDHPFDSPRNITITLRA